MTARVFKLLLRLYPARFRRAYGADMELVFRQRLLRARERGTTAFGLAFLRACLDLAGAAAAHRLGARRQRPQTDPVLLVFARDLRRAARAFVRQPAFFATVVATLGLGIGAAAAIASLVDATLRRPLPYPHADRLVALTEESLRFGKVPFAPPFLRDFREQLTEYDALAAFTSTWEVTLTGAGEARTVPAAFVSDGLLEMFGARARAGRLLTPGDQQGAERVAVVSARLWERAFGAHTPLAGHLLQINDEAVTVVGILDGDLRMPITASMAVATSQPAELWMPMAMNPLAALRTIPVANIVGRLRPGATVAQARQAFEQLPPRLAEVYREVPADARYQVTSLAALVAEPVRRPLLALLLAVGVLLLIACANVANLMLARSASRTAEFAIHSALGASRARLVQQTAAEALVIGFAGTCLGVLVAWLAITVMPAMALGELPPSATIQMDARVVAAASLIGLLVAAVVAVVPAMFASRAAVFAIVRDGSRTVDGGGGRARGALVSAEVALALVLLVSAGLLARSFWTLSRVDPGFRPDRLLASGVPMPPARYPTADARRAFVARGLDAIRAVPGVARAAAVNRLPLAGANVLVGVEIEGQPQPEGPVSMDRRVVTDGYFDTVGIPLRAGRMFGTEDRPDATDRVVIVNDAVARRFWRDGVALDRRLRLMLRSGPGPWLRVVGVVGDVRHHGLDQLAQPEVYVPYAQAPVESMVFLAQAAGEARALAAPVRQALQGIDPLLPVRQETPSELVDASIAEPRLRALLFNGFGLAALLLSALGIYGVVSHAVARRTREIGVRMALGATRGSILGLVMGSGLRVVIAGAVAGLAGAVLAARALRGMLFGIPALDPLTFAGVTCMLLLVASAAMLIPARRAMRLDPIRALRVD